MKTRTLVSILFLVLAVLLIAGSSATSMLKDSVYRGDCIDVKKYIEKGADVNAVNIRGNTALIEASSNGHTEIVKLLIEAGADVNAMTKFEVRSSITGKDFAPTGGYTALMAASEYGHMEIVKILIEAGADVNARDHKGWTAVNFALEVGHTEIVELLRESGAK